MKTLSQCFYAVTGIGVLLWRGVRHWWKSRSKCFRRTVVSLIALIPVGFAALFVWAYLDSRYGRAPWDDEYLTSNLEIHHYANGKKRIYNLSTEKYTTPRFNWVADAPKRGELVVYAQSGSRGYINTRTGRIVLPAREEWDAAWNFSEGKGAVLCDGWVRFINSNGGKVFEKEFLHRGRRKCAIDIDYQFYNNLCVVPDEDGKCGLIDTLGNWVVEPKYDEIYLPYCRERGYRFIGHEGKQGLISPEGKVIYDAMYDYVGVIDEGEAFILVKDGRMWREDKAGNVVVPFLVDSTEDLYYVIGCDEDGDNVIALSDKYAAYKVYTCYGIMNRQTGQPITAAVFGGVTMLSPEVFEVRLNDTSESYFLDTNGKMIEPK